jgi:hypothetical protein
MSLLIGVTDCTVVSVPFGRQSPATVQLQLVRELLTRSACNRTDALNYNILAFAILVASCFCFSVMKPASRLMHVLVLAWRPT